MDGFNKFIIKIDKNGADIHFSNKNNDSDATILANLVYKRYMRNSESNR